MNQPTKIPATATILIGGESKRFGSPKWAASFNGKTVLDHIWNACDCFENRVVLGKKKPESMAYPFIQDELDIRSSLNGIYSALNQSDSDWNFIISCDLPLMTMEIIKLIWESANDNGDAIVPKVNDFLQPTCAFYHKRILTQILKQIETGDLSLHGLLNSINTKTVFMDENEKEFTNMNTRDDYEKILLERK
jgi:molybdopterin-guanine dinucleotide biosynthesis protein A